MNDKKIIIGTRGSKLAIWQANFVSEQIKKICGIESELKIIKTKGDKILDSPLSKIGDKGLFVKEIENSLLAGEIDVAVHSLKDMPTVLPESLAIIAVSKREDPRDVFISKKYENISAIKGKAVIATSSLRRRAQILNFNENISTVDIRGNVETRIKKINEGMADGLIMAFAGIKRLGMEEIIKEVIDINIILPAVGQGCIAIEANKENKDVSCIINKINNKRDFIVTRAERALMRKLEGGCQIPIGALAEIKDDILYIEAIVASLDGKKLIREKYRGDITQPDKTGEEIADILISKGADIILDSIREGNE